MRGVVCLLIQYFHWIISVTTGQIWTKFGWIHYGKNSSPVCALTPALNAQMRTYPQFSHLAKNFLWKLPAASNVRSCEQDQMFKSYESGRAVLIKRTGARLQTMICPISDYPGAVLTNRCLVRQRCLQHGICVSFHSGEPRSHGSNFTTSLLKFGSLKFAVR